MMLASRMAGCSASNQPRSSIPASSCLVVRAAAAAAPRHPQQQPLRNARGLLPVLQGTKRAIITPDSAGGGSGGSDGTGGRGGGHGDGSGGSGSGSDGGGGGSPTDVPPTASDHRYPKSTRKQAVPFTPDTKIRDQSKEAVAKAAKLAASNRKALAQRVRAVIRDHLGGEAVLLDTGLEDNSKARVYKGESTLSTEEKARVVELVRQILETHPDQQAKLDAKGHLHLDLGWLVKRHEGFEIVTLFEKNGIMPPQFQVVVRKGDDKPQPRYQSRIIHNRLSCHHQDIHTGEEYFARLDFHARRSHNPNKLRVTVTTDMVIVSPGYRDLGSGAQVLSNSNSEAYDWFSGRGDRERLREDRMGSRWGGAGRPSHTVGAMQRAMAAAAARAAAAAAGEAAASHHCFWCARDYFSNDRPDSWREHDGRRWCNTCTTASVKDPQEYVRSEWAQRPAKVAGACPDVDEAGGCSACVV